MKKIAVISSYAYIRNNNNYGALFQYYAIQEFFKSQGVSPFWIKYVLPKTGYFFFLRHLLFREYKPSLFFKELVCHHQFMKFAKNRLSLSEKLYKENSDLVGEFPEVEFFVTGSDQVWGDIVEPNFLRFVDSKKKKVAFAVSFGRNVFSEKQLTSGVPEWIKEFFAVSVREDTGKDLCKSIGVDATLLLDPTFLLNKQDYIFDKNKKKKLKYIMCYFLNVNDRNEVGFKELENFSKNEGLKMKITAVGSSGMKFPSRFCKYPSPEKWLENYCYSDYVVTNTFHGTVFAIIFRKNFVCVLLEGELARMNTRLISLLKRFGLEDRIWNGKSDLSELLKKEIDWKVVDEEIEKNRIDCLGFFKEAGVL